MPSTAMTVPAVRLMPMRMPMMSCFMVPPFFYPITAASLRRRSHYCCTCFKNPSFTRSSSASGPAPKYAQPDRCLSENTGLSYTRLVRIFLLRGFLVPYRFVLPFHLATWAFLSSRTGMAPQWRPQCLPTIMTSLLAVLNTALDRPPGAA